MFIFVTRMTNQSDIITPIAANENNIFKRVEKHYTQPEETSFNLHDMVIVTGCLLFSLVMVTCLCCLCIKISDLKLKCYIRRTARRKGLNVDMAALDESCRMPKDETCTIYVPDMFVTYL